MHSFSKALFQYRRSMYSEFRWMEAMNIFLLRRFGGRVVVRFGEGRKVVRWMKSRSSKMVRVRRIGRGRRYLLLNERVRRGILVYVVSLESVLLGHFKADSRGGKIR